MSKVKLRKVLETFDQEQLVNIILQAYDARKEFKEYFEFFANPDVNSLKEKFVALVDKEFRRTKWGYSKARVTKLREFVREYSSVQPGYGDIIEFYFYILKNMVVMFTMYGHTETQRNATVKMLKESAEYAQQVEMFDYWMEEYKQLKKVSLKDKRLLKRVLEEANLKLM
jgi:hypothetical protein